MFVNKILLFIEFYTQTCNYLLVFLSGFNNYDHLGQHNNIVIYVPIVGLLVSLLDLNYNFYLTALY